MCTLLSLLMLGFVTAVSVFPYPDRPAIFFSPVLVGMAVIFLFSFRQLFLSLTLYALVFIVLAVLFKAPAALVYDIWAVIPGLYPRPVRAVVVVKLRVSDSRSRARWMQLSVLDRPTGLLNKASCEELCRRFLCMEPDTRSAMLIVDMDHFKEINDSEGHLFGDKVLYGIGAILQNDLDEDTITGRIGGDEFLILVKHARGTAAENLAGRCSPGCVRRTSRKREPRSHAASVSPTPRPAGRITPPFSNRRTRPCTRPNAAAETAGPYMADRNRQK